MSIICVMPDVLSAHPLLLSMLMLEALRLPLRVSPMGSMAPPSLLRRRMSALMIVPLCLPARRSMCLASALVRLLSLLIPLSPFSAVMFFLLGVLPAVVGGPGMSILSSPILMAVMVVIVSRLVLPVASSLLIIPIGRLFVADPFTP